MPYMKNKEGTVITFPIVSVKPSIGLYLRTDVAANNQWKLHEYEASLILENGVGMNVVVLSGVLRFDSDILIAVSKLGESNVNRISYKMESSNLDDELKLLNDNIEQAIMRFLIPLMDEDTDWLLYEDDAQEEPGPTPEQQALAQHEFLHKVIGGNG